MKRLVLGTLLSCVLLIPFSAFAEDNDETTNWVAGINYIHLSDALYHWDFNVITGSLGYKFQTTDNFTLIPEISIGMGVNEHDEFFEQLEVKTYVALSLRGQYQLEKWHVSFCCADL